MADDPRDRLALARRAHAEAVAERRALTPGAPGYRDAVQRVGVTWAAVQHWQRRLLARQRRPDGRDGDAGPG